GGKERGEGEGGNDVLYGEAGDDVLNGGPGHDVLVGGLGTDRFLFDSPISGGGNIDLVADFDAATETIELAGTVFTGLSPGRLDAAHFSLGNASGTGPQIVYDDASGALYFDSNGANPGGSTQFATLAGAPHLAASNFLVM